MATPPEQLIPRGTPDWLIGGGEMDALLRTIDWPATPLGPIGRWPQSLRTALSICLMSRFPMAVCWGTSYVILYNDAYRPILGAKHPWAMGRPCFEVWSELAHIVRPMFDEVIETGVATWSDDLMLPMLRHGYLEEAYFTLSYSAICGESGRPEGVFVTCTETTQRYLAERRLRLVRELGDAAGSARSPEQAAGLAGEILAGHPADVPFSLLYRIDAAAGEACLAATTGVQRGHPAAPERVPLAHREARPWPLGRLLDGPEALVVDDLTEAGPLPGGIWPDPARAAVLLPIPGPGQANPVAVLVAGVNPRRALVERHHEFFRLVARQIANMMANAIAHEETRKRAEALAELDRAKTAFFSNVSHEFRTPLTLLLGPLEEVLAEAGGLPAETRERLEVAHRNSLRLLKLVNTLLDFSRLEAGRIEAAYEPTDLATLTAELASVFRSAIERAGLRLLVDCPPLDEPVYVDREMWEKITLNLLSNAFKFTFEGEIEVSLRKAGETVELAVRDTGTGIPPEEIPHLFERFHRVKGARGRSFEGSGIGLALVQELVKLHGGAVRVESEADRGTTFAVSLPTGKAHLPTDRIGAARALASTGPRSEAYVEDALRWLPEESSEMRERSTPSVRILLADDNADMREYVRRLLGQEHEVVAVPDGEAALRAAREQPFDLVLTDVMMPRLDGFGLLAALRSDERTKTLPVILLSARAGEESKVEGMAAGADDYLVKPFSARELLARVNAHLRLQRVRRETQEALRASEAKFSIAFDQSPLALTITSGADGRLVEVNEGFVQLSGYTREEAVGRTPEELGLWIDPKQRAERFARLLAGERVPNLEARFRVKSGAELIGVIGSALVEINGRLCVLSSVIDITERKEMEEALKEADRRKDEFLAMLAHELRNPLAPIRIAAQVLKLLGPADDRQQRAREVIERQTQHLTRLVDDLLDVSRITRGKITLAREPLELSAIVHRAVEASRPQIEARRHRLTVALPPEPVHLEGDLTRLVQVIDNLLNNAAKYTDEGGHIHLEAAKESGEAVLRVRDDGIGLTADLLPRIFDLFTQADRSLDRSQGGLGIGLTLVRRLVELHGGRVEARSDGPGRGSEFIVRLPVSTTEAVCAEAASGESAPASRALKILVVEDNEDAAEMMAFFLKLRGHEVQTAYNGPAALEAVRTFQPHALLCDIGLPGMSGYELAACLREQPAFQRTPLIALTGYGQEEARRRALEAGFDHHLVKPVEPEALDALLKSFQGGGTAE